MKKRIIVLFLVLVMVIAAVSSAADINMTKIPNEVRAKQIQDMKWGMFICWSFSTFSGREWTPTKGKGPEYFKVTGCDTDQWCKTAKDAGMGYILFLSKHHDGFCLWDTKTTEKKVTNSPIGVDVLAKLRKSCDKYGIKLALYFSEGDWTWPGARDGGRNGGRNPEVKKAQLKELLTNYGPIEFWWIDHAAGTGGLSHKQTVKWMHKFQPNTFVGFNHGQPAGRLCLRERGRPGRLGDSRASKYNKDVEKSHSGFYVAEFTYPILPKHRGGADWFYSLPRHDNLCYPASKVFKDYNGAMKYENIFSINIGPNYAGKIRDIDVKTLTEVGGMIKADRKLEELGITGAEKLNDSQVKEMLSWLKSDQWRFQRAGINGVAAAVKDEKYYVETLKALESTIVKSTHPYTLDHLGDAAKAMASASPEIQKASVSMLGRAYTAGANQKGSQNKTNTIAAWLSTVPGGLDELYRVSAKPNSTELPHLMFYMSSKILDENPIADKAFKQHVVKVLIPEHLKKHSKQIDGLMTDEVKPVYPSRHGDSIAQLVKLYEKIGVTDYRWNRFGPDRFSMQWDYHSFNPDDKKPYKTGETRYRKVNYPAGMENWFATDFDPAKTGWKKGYAPFGNKGGKPVPEGTCKANHCRCGDPVKTFWEKEVLLLRGKFKFPKMKDGHRYRFNIGGNSHVFGGDGVAVYINGKFAGEQVKGVQKHHGGRPRGIPVPQELFNEFQGREVTIAVTSFLRKKRNSGIVGNYMTVWMEEMKIPPIN